MSRLTLSRAQVLAHRRRVGLLDSRRAWQPAFLRRAAWAGLTDSVPRAALLSLHARLAGTPTTAWQDPAFVQVWGPRFSAYVVPEQDRAVFTLGRTSTDPGRRRHAEDLADRLEAFLEGRELSYAEAGHGIGEHPNQLRYATTTGRVLLRWDGARRPTVRMAPAPQMTVDEARRELARRYLHVLGPGTAEGLGAWAGVRGPSATAALTALEPELTAVRTEVGDAWALTDDVESLRAPSPPAEGVRLLPSGDTYYLCQGSERDLLVPEPVTRAQLWTSRVWPGAVLVDGEIVGTWRRAEHRVTVSPWSALSATVRDAVAAEASTLPLPDLTRPVTTSWVG